MPMRTEKVDQQFKFLHIRSLISNDPDEGWRIFYGHFCLFYAFLSLPFDHKKETKKIIFFTFHRWFLALPS